MTESMKKYKIYAKKHATSWKKHLKLDMVALFHNTGRSSCKVVSRKLSDSLKIP